MNEHTYVMDGESLRVDGHTHWYRCSGCTELCQIGGANGSGSSKCCGAVVANIRYGLMLPPGYELPPELRQRVR